MSFSLSLETDRQSYRCTREKTTRAVMSSLFTHSDVAAILDDLNVLGAPPAPGVVGDNVGRVGDERGVVRIQLARLVTGTVVVRVTDR